MRSVQTNTRFCWCIAAGAHSTCMHMYMFSVRREQVTPSSGVISSPPSPHHSLSQPHTNNGILAARNEIVRIMMIVILMHYNHSSVSHSTNGSPDKDRCLRRVVIHYFIIFSVFFFLLFLLLLFRNVEAKKKKKTAMRTKNDVYTMLLYWCARALSLFDRFHTENVRSTRNIYFFLSFAPSYTIFIHSFCCLCAVVVHYIFVKSHNDTMLFPCECVLCEYVWCVVPYHSRYYDVAAAAAVAATANDADAIKKGWCHR